MICFFLQPYMTIFVSYSQQKCFPGRKIERFSTICISKPPENGVFWIIFCLWVHCIITAALQVASKRQPERKYPSKADPILVQLQKYSEISLLTLYIFGQHTEDVSHYILPRSGSVTPLQHWQFSSPCSLGVFSGKKQILLFGNTCSHFISFSFCYILVMSSFKNCLENGNRLVIASKKTNKKQNKLRIASVKEVFPSCLLLWVFIPYPWEAVRRLPLTLHQNPRDFYGRCIWSSFGDVYDAEKKKCRRLWPCKPWPRWAAPPGHTPSSSQGLYLPKSHTHWTFIAGLL